MIERNGKKFYDPIETHTNHETVSEMTKMPRVGCVTVIRDKDTDYVNAGVYSGGVMSLNPYQIIFGVKSWDSKVAFEKISEFVIGLPSKSQLMDMWIFANDLPHGISEIDVAGLTEYAIPGIDTPGIKEFPINLKCKVANLFKLGGPLRNIIVADVTGISMDVEFIKKPRKEAISNAILHEAIQRHKYTGHYACSVMSDELIDGEWADVPEFNEKDYDVVDGKVYISSEQFYDRKYSRIFSNAVFARPNYIVNTVDSNQNYFAEATTGGLIMHSRPAVQALVRKDSQSYKNIKENGQFTISIPTRENVTKYKELMSSPGSLEKVGFTPITSGEVKPYSVQECPVNIECTAIFLEDLNGSDYALALAHKTGVNLDKNIGTDGIFTELYGDYLYTLFDYDMKEKIGHHDDNYIPIPPLPTWGSRWNGGWWGGPEGWQSGFQFWLLELLTSNYLSETEYHTLKKWISWWRSEGYPPPEPLKTEIRARLTTILGMMVRAHRSYEKWHEVHDFFKKFENDYDGPWRC